MRLLIHSSLRTNSTVIATRLSEMYGIVLFSFVSYSGILRQAYFCTHSAIPVTQHTLSYPSHTTHTQLSQSHSTHSAIPVTQHTLSYPSHTTHTQLSQSHNTHSAIPVTQHTLSYPSHTTHTQLSQSHVTALSVFRYRRNKKLQMKINTTRNLNIKALHSAVCPEWGYSSHSYGQTQNNRPTQTPTFLQTTNHQTDCQPFPP
jgi:hypothetical protein